MKLTYKPYIRDSLFDDFHIENPVLDITGYRPKYTQDLVEIEEVQPVKSDIKEIEEISSKKSNKEFRDREEFKDTMTSLYKDLLYKKGINPLFAKALVAQDGLESAWGSKPSGKFNFGGIKGKGTVKRTREVINGKDVYINDSFRDFDSLEDYANFKINLLNNRYHAFSGDISEFADRVHKGGYATDPNYSRVLNSIITSIKNGGIIKAQQGGVLQGKEWVKNWYKNRRSQIKSNIQRNRWFSVPVTGTLGYNILSKNMDLTSASVDPSKVPSGAKGVYYPRWRRIYLRDDSPSTAIHEWVHGSNPEPQVREIERIKGILGKTFYDQELTVPDDYLDNPQEIYSRLMQLRYALGVSPDHVFTNEEIEDLKRQHIVKEALINKLKSKDGNIEGTSTTIFDKHGNVIETEPLDPNYKLVPEESKSYRMYDNNETFNILDRYSTDGIRRLLNEVAQIPKKEKAINYVKLGFKVPKYQEPSGPIKNSSEPWRVWNDYSNQKPVDPNWRAPMLSNTTEKYIPTLKDLIKFTTSYETFNSKPYTIKNNITGKDQSLIGYGFADSELLKKYNNGMPKDVADSIVEKKLSRIYNYFKDNTKWFNNLTPGTQLALTDIAYNGRDVQEITKHSPNLLAMLEDGVTDPRQLVKEMNHSASANGWLGVRSAARRAMALGEYDWQPKKVDIHGRALREDMTVGQKDWESSPYYKKY